MKIGLVTQGIAFAQPWAVFWRAVGPLRKGCFHPGNLFW